MRRAALPILALGAAAVALSGCVVAVPVIAGAAIGKRAIDRKRAARVVPAVLAAEPAVAPLPLAASPPPDRVRLLPVATPTAAGWSGELPGDPWRQLLRYSAEKMLNRPIDSVVLEAGATPEIPKWMACQAKPRAVVFDVELQGSSTTQQAIDLLRAMGLEVMFMGGRPIDDAQRAAIGKRYCVVAIAGDQPGDFTALLVSATSSANPALGATIGAGWFLAPQPRVRARGIQR